MRCQSPSGGNGLHPQRGGHLFLDARGGHGGSDAPLSHPRITLQLAGVGPAWECAVGELCRHCQSAGRRACSSYRHTHLKVKPHTQTYTSTVEHRYSRMKASIKMIANIFERHELLCEMLQSCPLCSVLGCSHSLERCCISFGWAALLKTNIEKNWQMTSVTVVVSLSYCEFCWKSFGVQAEHRALFDSNENPFGWSYVPTDMRCNSAKYELCKYGGKVYRSLPHWPDTVCYHRKWLSPICLHIGSGRWTNTLIFQQQFVYFSSHWRSNFLCS